MPVSLEGLHPVLMRPRVEALLADADARTLGLHVVSAFRSIERQRKLWEAAVRKYGSAEKARRWVAPPGRSNHGPKVDGFGVAVDFGLPGVDALDGQWPSDVDRRVGEIARRHGLFSPLEWEDWHYEPIKDWAPTEEDDMEIPNDVVVDTLDCSVPDCPGGWWELRRDGTVETVGSQFHEAHHYFGSIFEPWMAPNRPSVFRATAIGPRRGGAGYTTWGFDDRTRLFYEFGPGVGPVPLVLPNP